VYEQRGWGTILRSITAPVVLFGLAILVIGGTTVSIVGFSDLGSSHKLLVALGAAALLLTILLMVFLLTWFKPQNLIYSESGYLEESAMAWGASENPAARDVLARRRGQPRIRRQPPEGDSGGLET
jgi:hypothetical protein